MAVTKKTNVLWDGKSAFSGGKKSTRPEWDEYFLKLAMLVAERSTCQHHHVGAVVVRDKHVIATGYNGAPAGMKDCLELGCLRDELGVASGTRHELCRAIHAEQNAIIQTALHGGGMEGVTIYCTHTPCVLCAKMLVNCKITRFVTFIEYADESFIKLFKARGILFERRNRPNTRISALD
jgi:dCMP deaminase